MRRLPISLLILVAAASAPSSLAAQCSASASDTASLAPHPFATASGVSGDRDRIAQDLGRCSTRSALIRSAASLNRPLGSGNSFRWAVVPLSLDATYNSAIPYSINDGPQFAARGVTTTILGGVRAEAGPLSISVAPQLVYEQNRQFFVFPSTTPGRNLFASPWHSHVESADLPLRFGDGSRKSIYPGESWIELRSGPVVVGGSTDGQWWGPGIRNALVMSDNAGGVPRLYLRSANPLATPAGDVEFQFLIGGLTESRFFDTVSTNNIRSLSAAVATLRVAFDTGLTVGVARSVYSSASSSGSVVSHTFDVLSRWNQRPDTNGPVRTKPSDQLLSLFGRWVFPQAGVEVYGEWAKLFAPGIREMLVAPQAHQGFTVGLQWVNPLPAGRAFRLQTEATTLEQTPPATRVAMPSFYTSQVVPQGYTQLGQVIGAAIGPGASSQWLAGDFMTPKWRVGAFIGRTRTEEDVLYSEANGNSAKHDVTILSGVRAGWRAPVFDLSGELTVARRYNYLFQDDAFNAGETTVSAVDVQNLTLTFRLTPRSPRGP
ncbi:MAG: capsule assembly Wzi family protein [bacterium]